NVGVTCTSQAGLPAERISFQDPEDFEPDHVFAALSVFEALRTRRSRLQNDATFAAEAQAICEISAPPEAPQDDPVEESSTSPPVSPSDVLGAALERTEAAQKPMLQQLAEGHLDIDAFTRRIVQPYVLQKSDPRKPELIAAVDAAIADSMRRLLHDPNWQGVESAWRGIQLLIRRLETGRELQISVLSVSRSDLRQDVCGQEDLTRSQLYKVLLDGVEIAGANPWSAVLGDFVFGDSQDDVQFLGRLARMHHAAGSRFVTAASPAVVGCCDLAQQPDPHDWQPRSNEQVENWNELRGLSASASVNLLLPRILGRRPYGADSNPVEAFAFDEIPGGEPHEAYLWMNPAYAAGVLLGQRFIRSGGNDPADWEPQLDRLPMHVYETEEDSMIKPCGEVELSLRAGEVFMERGLSAVYSVRDEDTVRIPPLRPFGQDHR
ncbi:MAG: type VI secretion system contractile sheath large subunit, partial [Fuerstiella sp.]|nr:type VI secretion system contractile sheath large subunit [Fuerstiella sp.]